MVIWILIVLNIPVFIFLGWLAFDSTGRAADTIFDTVVAVLKQIFVPRIIRILMDMDTSDAVGVLPIAGYLIACGFVLVCEYSLLESLGWVK